ncbi:hypothetical protein DFH07DRAFT_938481 [Mycena maculata]|uniref:Uncharacterized protein n=1 Tax=Mycena maculata TaxID=230809 RepID=A0AAD7NME5_9AGAR|nr:hypothetical protein DFH07DRAFT_938481 [Mycena maculata]
MSSHFTSPHCCFALFECRLAFAFPRCHPQPSEHVSQKRRTFVMRTTGTGRGLKFTGSTNASNGADGGGLRYARSLIWHVGQTSGGIRRDLANFGWADVGGCGRTRPDGIFTGPKCPSSTFACFYGRRSSKKRGRSEAESQNKTKNRNRNDPALNRKGYSCGRMSKIEFDAGSQDRVLLLTMDQVQILWSSSKSSSCKLHLIMVGHRV